MYSNEQVKGAATARGVRRRRIARNATPRELMLTHCADILHTPTLQMETRCMQHGSTSILEHSAQVCAWSLVVARELRIPVDEVALARGALLHDYFLYDWHRPHPDNYLHGFRHPFVAARNATRDFDLGPLERDIILTHMFPLVPLPPTSREALLVCLVDTACALHETVRRRSSRRK